MNNHYIDLETTAEIVKKILPKMGEYKVPITPQNYRVWFEYYSGTNKELTEEIEHFYNEQWNKIRFTSATFDENQNRLSVNKLLWEDDDWKHSDRNLYTYDENNKQLTHLRQWFIENSWENFSQNYYQYSPEGSLLLSIYYLWENEEWQKDRKVDYITDDFGNTITAENYEWIDGSWVLESDYVTIYYNNGNSLKGFNGYRVEAKYGLLSSINEISNNIFSNINISPNPTINYSKITLNLSDNINADINMYDILGNKLKEIFKGNLQKGEHQFNLNFEDLSVGVYFMKFSSGKSSETIKVIHI